MASLASPYRRGDATPRDGPAAPASRPPPGGTVRFPRLAIVALLVPLTACASSAGTSASTVAPAVASTAPASGAAKPDTSRLALEDITKADLPTAYDLVERLRRPWLRRQGALGGEVAV